MASAIGSFARAASTPAARDGLPGGTFDATARTATKLGAFLAQAHALGIERASGDQGLESLASLTPTEALFALAEAFGERDGSLAASVSYAALSNTIQDLLEEAPATDTGELFDWLESGPGMQHLFETFIANTVEGLLFSELGDRLENADITSSEADLVIAEMHDYIREQVRFSLQGVAVSHVDWGGAEGEALVRASLDAALSTLRAADV